MGPIIKTSIVIEVECMPTQVFDNTSTTWFSRIVLMTHWTKQTKHHGRVGPLVRFLLLTPRADFSHIMKFLPQCCVSLLLPNIKSGDSRECLKKENEKSREKGQKFKDLLDFPGGQETKLLFDYLVCFLHYQTSKQYAHTTSTGA